MIDELYPYAGKLLTPHLQLKSIYLFNIQIGISLGKIFLIGRKYEIKN